MKYKLYLSVEHNDEEDKNMRIIDVCSIKTPSDTREQVSMGEALSVGETMSSFILPLIHRYVGMNERIKEK